MDLFKFPDRIILKLSADSKSPDLSQLREYCERISARSSKYYLVNAAKIELAGITLGFYLEFSYFGNWDPMSYGDAIKELIQKLTQLPGIQVQGIFAAREIKY